MTEILSWSDRCLMPHIQFGDIAQCLLQRGHDGTCAEANAAARAESQNTNAIIDELRCQLAATRIQLHAAREALAAVRECAAKRAGR